jgi:hypothetical protein
MDVKDIVTMQGIVDVFEEFDGFFEDAKMKMKPILDEIYEHYESSDDLPQGAHALMLGMSLKHDVGKPWSLFDVPKALQYAKNYIPLQDK